MSLHTGSSAMAHNLDRSSFRADFEDVAGEAARLNVPIDTLRCYLDWYGKEQVTVIIRRGKATMPAFEAEVRWQFLGERIRIIQRTDIPGIYALSRYPVFIFCPVLNSLRLPPKRPIQQRGK